MQPLHHSAEKARSDAAVVRGRFALRGSSGWLLGGNEELANEAVNKFQKRVVMAGLDLA